jgi:uncharacterized protein YktA (UPF0223 family)
MPSNYICSGWCCRDCLFLLANGDTDPDWTEEELAEFLVRFNKTSDEYDITLGMLREEHDCRSNHTILTADGKEREVLEDNEVEAYLNVWDAGILRVTPHELETDGDRGKDDYCEQREFSTSSCDVCGSTLHGDRHAVAFFSKTLPLTKADIMGWDAHRGEFIAVMEATV